MMELEICVDSVESAAAAEAGGAQRVELCSGLVEGGLTPSLGLIRAVRLRVDIGVHVIIRPRSGDFVYSFDELAVMRDDIALASQSGVEGVVLGLLTADGGVDIEATRDLVELARPMEVTFHRAIDLTRDLEKSLQDVIATGADRVLTSGGEQTALLGSKRIGAMVRAAKGRIAMMVGGGVRAENVQEIALATGAVEFHTALRSHLTSPGEHEAPRVHLGDAGIDGFARHQVTTANVRAMREAMDLAYSREQNLT